MGQTLTHGVYLPSEGERNCYSGLASNWRLLDGAIGTVAAHTTAIAGKAPLVHTHSKADITDFPAYGTTAGTICEGNDSRLSDARTPVAHTHTKSNVTDLLNSNFIPSTNNSYDLGSSSYQWNNLYAKNYYYNGVAWGLDKANVWTVSQRMACNPTIWDMKNTTYTLGTAPSGNKYLGFIFYDSADTDMGRLCVQCHRNGNNYYILGLKNSDGTNAYDGALRYSASRTNERAFYPEGNTDLGTSTAKWKTLNGINPGALSLPDMDSTVSRSTELATAIDKTQTANSWTADFTGILRITWFVKNLTGPFRCTVCNNSDIRYATWGQTFSVNDAWYFIVSFPVQNGKTYYFDNSFTRTSEDTAPIIYGASAVYCLGNV